MQSSSYIGIDSDRFVGHLFFILCLSRNVIFIISNWIRYVSKSVTVLSVLKLMSSWVVGMSIT